MQKIIKIPNTNLFARSYQEEIELFEKFKQTTAIAIIGSRKCTPYGYKVCERIISDLKPYNVSIISGLAYGIDQYAHEFALENGIQTLAVLPSSLEDWNIYPKANQGIAQRILKNGGLLISEHPKERSPKKYDFISRNKVIADLCKILIVVEASEQSGTLWTVRFALDKDKIVGAVPGPIFSETSSGCNQLIQDGACVITSAKDIIELCYCDKLF